MQSLGGDAATQWRQEFKKEKVDTYTFDYFKTFLLNLVADPENRRLLAHERFNSARQAKDQKVSVFKAYLEELESHLEPMPEQFRASIFLTKIRPELKDKILGTGRVPSTREEILALAIMQTGAFIWPDDAEDAFQELCQKFTEAPLLRHFDPSQRIRVETDASAFAITGILSQPDDAGH